MIKWFRNMLDSLMTNIIFALLMTIMFALLNEHAPQFIDTFFKSWGIAFVFSTLIANSGIFKIINMIKLGRAIEEIKNGER